MQESTMEQDKLPFTSIEELIASLPVERLGGAVHVSTESLLGVTKAEVSSGLMTDGNTSSIVFSPSEQDLSASSSLMGQYLAGLVNSTNYDREVPVMDMVELVTDYAPATAQAKKKFRRSESGRRLLCRWDSNPKLQLIHRKRQEKKDTLPCKPARSSQESHGMQNFQWNMDVEQDCDASPAFSPSVSLIPLKSASPNYKKNSQCWSSASFENLRVTGRLDERDIRPRQPLRQP